MALTIFNVSEDTAAWLFWDSFSHYEIQFPYPFNQKSSLEFTSEGLAWHLVSQLKKTNSIIIDAFSLNPFWSVWEMVVLNLKT